MRTYPIATSAYKGYHAGYAEDADQALAEFRAWCAREDPDVDIGRFISMNLGTVIWNTPVDGKYLTGEAWVPVEPR